MNVKNHHFFIRRHVSSRTTGKQKCGIAFLHPQLFTIGGFELGDNLQVHIFVIFLGKYIRLNAAKNTDYIKKMIQAKIV